MEQFHGHLYHGYLAGRYNKFLFLFHGLQVSWLHNAGKEVVVVTSGAVAIGKLRVKQEQLLSRSVRHTLLSSAGKTGMADDLEPRACAAAGQAGLMSLYETMFNQYGVGCAQVRSVGECYFTTVQLHACYAVVKQRSQIL